MKNNPNFQNSFVILGLDWEVTLPSNLYYDLEKFTCCLYGNKVDNVNSGINEWRYRLFCSKETLIPISYLLARIHCSNILPELIIKLRSGDLH